MRERNFSLSRFLWRFAKRRRLSVQQWGQPTSLNTDEPSFSAMKFSTTYSSARFG